MKKLMFLVWGITMSISLDAQVVLEGEFAGSSPARQIWDGTFLVFQNTPNTIIYDYTEKEKFEINTNETEYIRFKNGMYFLENDSKKYDLMKVGNKEPLFEESFDQIGFWFGDIILVWREITGLNRGFEATWISDEGKVIAKHRLDSISKAIGIRDYNNYMLNYGVRSVSSSFKTVYSEGYLALKDPESEKWGYYDLALNRKIEHRFFEADPFFEGFAAVQNEQGLWGFIDKEGEIKVPFKFRYKPGPFSDGMALVRNRNNKIGFIDKSGELIIPAIYDEASNFYKGFTLAKSYKLGKEWVLLDKSGVESPSPGKNFYPVKYNAEFPDKAGYFPYLTLKDLIDQGKGVFKYASNSMIFSFEGELIFQKEYGIVKNLVGNEFIMIHINDFSKNYIPMAGLMNLQGEWLIKVKRSEF